ncbi:hypothetical protein [Actinospica robiniae]|uniref:hypothetical protein n=1 Tax=Actinospica robiniae TaxID=304901 RepID=UPI00055368C1|nr:hypothetical protein [Actinospica robiniae]
MYAARSSHEIAQVFAAEVVGVARDNRKVSDEKLRTWFKAEATYARAAAASWIGDPRVHEVLDEARPSAVTACDFLLRFMHNQIQTTRFCWWVCRIGTLLPDGREDHGPFRSDSADPWMLTAQERELAGHLVALFHQRVVLATAHHLAEVGVPLDPEWPGDHAVLAVLLLLPAVGYEIPWDGSITEFAKQIQPEILGRRDRLAALTFHQVFAVLAWLWWGFAVVPGGFGSVCRVRGRPGCESHRLPSTVERLACSSERLADLHRERSRGWKPERLDEAQPTTKILEEPTPVQPTWSARAHRGRTTLTCRGRRP